MMHPTAERPERYILCLDDDRDFLKSLEIFLPDQVNSGADAKVLYHFVFADDPAEALQALTELVAEGSIVAMIITDQQMPSMKGIDFLLHARRLTSNSIRILLTGYAGIEAAISAINERLLDCYLTKPIEDRHGFALSVRQLLQRFEMSRVIERQSATLQGLYQFANQINGLNDLQAMRDYVVAFTCETLRCSTVHVDLPDAGEGTLSEVDVTAGKSASPPAPSRTAPVGARAPTTGRLDDAQEIPSDLGALVFRASLAPGMPAAYARMRMGESCAGWILASRGVPERFTDHDLQTLGYIADTASTAIGKQQMWIRLEDSYRITKEQAARLEEANEKLVLLDRMKRDFLEMISHELRTPLGHVSAISMLDEEVDPKEQLELTSIIRQGYERLNRFIALGLEYLDWSGRGRVDTRETADLGSIVTRGVESIQANCSRKVDWDLAVPTEPCLVRMPSAQVEDVLRVLIDNALKFSSSDPRVRVEVRSEPGHATLRVGDRGRGFLPELATRIFEPFTVLDTTHYEGTGLNLARIQAMIEAFGGETSAESSGPSQGATFTIEFPLGSFGDRVGADPSVLVPVSAGMSLKG